VLQESLESCGRRVGSVVMRNSIHYTENFKGILGTTGLDV
jgi:hypothetical protein